jgi:hypothetical protein
MEKQRERRTDAALGPFRADMGGAPRADGGGKCDDCD